MATEEAECVWAGAEFSGGSIDAHSTDSDSWDTSKEPIRRRRRDWRVCPTAHSK